ncbi:HDIG domain-containing protein [Candidatus Woesearchaeota archaeon]|nr:HDIG domain-containing protein [Candidatus Woesearchaeota archaeon]
MDWFEEFKVPKNILQHCLKVREVALLLAQKLKNKGIDIDLELIGKAALLHDLFKVVSFKELKSNRFHDYVFTPEETAMWRFLREKYPKMYEGEVAYVFFNEDYPELALSLKNISDLKKQDKTWEELLVHYADWRVFRNNIVSVQERMDYLREVYPRTYEEWERDFHTTLAFEQRIMEKIGLSPEQLVGENNSSGEGCDRMI